MKYAKVVNLYEKQISVILPNNWTDDDILCPIHRCDLEVHRVKISFERKSKDYTYDMLYCPKCNEYLIHKCMYNENKTLFDYKAGPFIVKKDIKVSKLHNTSKPASPSIKRAGIKTVSLLEECTKFEYDRDHDIHYLYDYIPSRYWNSRPDDLTITKKILNLKDGYTDDINFFSKKLNPAMEELFLGTDMYFQDLFFLSVPSHKAYKSGSMNPVIENICTYLRLEGYKVHNICDRLVRIKDHPKLSYGGDRSVESHLETISFKYAPDIKDKFVFLFDDIFTSGNSLKACEELIMDSGSEYVFKITVGKTI